MRVRACNGCRKYIIIRPNDLKNKIKIEEFEKFHKGHTLVSMDLEEVKGSYENVEGDLEAEELLTKNVIQEELMKCNACLSGKMTFKKAFGFSMEDGLSPLMRYFEQTTDTHDGKYAIYDGRITQNYVKWLEKQLVSKILL